MAGITSKKKEIVVNVMPPRPEYKFMSKADVVADMKKQREIAAKTKAFADSLQKEEAPVEISKEQLKANPGNGMVDGSDASTPGHLEGAETPLVAKKKPGRPKKIE